jgi:hypothetical protein
LTPQRKKIFQMNAVTALLPFLVMAGCTTPGDTNPKEAVSQVTVYREPSSRDSLFPMYVTVDGRLVAQLQPGEERSFELPKGNHRLEYELGLYSCSVGVQLQSGKRYAYRLARSCVIAPEEIE